MTRRLGVLVGMLVAGAAAAPVLADLPLGPMHLIVGDPMDRIWHYKVNANDENSADKSSSTFSPVTPVVIDDLKPGDVVRFRIPGLTHGFTPVEGNATKKLGLVVRCGENPNDPALTGAVLQELDCQPGQSVDMSKVDKRLNGPNAVRLQVLQTFSNPVEFICTQHGPNMRGRLQLQK
jgi:hypothetical protein